MPELRDHTAVLDPRLDRLEHFDEASRDYPVRTLLGEQALQTRLWTLPVGAPVLDQRNEGACVGFAFTNELRFHPCAVPGLGALFAREQVYWPAQRVDAFAGGSYPGANPLAAGTSVLAGARVLTAAGYYEQYRWAFSEPDLAGAVSAIGPAVIGVPWYSGMFRPDAAGYLNPTGTVQGGHAVLVIGITARHGYYTIYNSWGVGWGNRGTARIRRPVMDRLLHENGEACVVTGRHRTATDTTIPSELQELCQSAA